MASSTTHQFPFGRPLRTCGPSADGKRKAFVLDAYPSALHVRWSPPPGESGAPIQAIPVDNEPEPFWTGEDAQTRVEAWSDRYFDRAEFGQVEAASDNGRSGRALDSWYLRPLGLTRVECWITDCLDTYQISDGAAQALTDHFTGFAERRGLLWNLPAHPDEAAIVREATDQHLERLGHELDQCQPELVVTLGNAAMRVFATLVGANDAPEKITDNRYPQELTVTRKDSSIRWVPMVHPGLVLDFGKRRLALAHREWQRFQDLLQERGGLLYRRVVVSGETPEWAAGTPRHQVAAVWFPESDSVGWREWPDHHAEFAEDIEAGPAVVITGRGYADRTAFGELIVGRDLLAMSYPGHQRLRCAAISEKPEPNMDWVYRRNGFEIIRLES